MRKSTFIDLLPIISGSRFHINIVSILYVPINERDVHAKSGTNIGGGTKLRKIVLRGIGESRFDVLVISSHLWLKKCHNKFKELCL